MAFWDNTYGFLSNVGTARARFALWVAYVVGALLVLAVPIALIFRALGSKQPAAVEKETAPKETAPKETAPKETAPENFWRQFQTAKPSAVLASFACCVLVALLIVLLSRWSLQATQEYKPYAALGGVDLLLGMFDNRRS
jgi:hypothetical protein